MARHRTSGPSSSGRRGSSRSESGGKSSSGRSRPAGKSFRKSDSRDSGKSSTGKPSFHKSSSTGDDRNSFGKKRAAPSRDSRGERPFKKFDKPYGKKREGSSDAKEGSYGNKRAAFSKGPKRPYKKFDADDRGKKSGDFSKGRAGDRPFKRDKPFGRRDEGPSSPERSSGSKRAGFSKDHKRPYKKFDSERGDKPFRKNERGRSFGNRKDEDKPREGKKESGVERGFFKKSESGHSERPRRKRTEEQGETAAPLQTEKIRLNKYIANSGVCSRREADELITMGLITVNGKTISEMGYKVNPGDEVRYEDRVLTAEKPVYILMNKPKGYLTTTDDPQERNTVMQLIGNAVKERIYPVGRLDRNTTGLLLLTNDGDLADKLMHPSYNMKKIYKVELDRPLTKADFQTILEGVVLEEGRAMVDDLAIISEDSKTIGIELHIGWNRVVRRIFESLQYEVSRLDRTVYAGLDKKDLGRGEWRYLTKEELVRLKHYK